MVILKIYRNFLKFSAIFGSKHKFLTKIDTGNSNLKPIFIFSWQIFNSQKIQFPKFSIPKNIQFPKNFNFLKINPDFKIRAARINNNHISIKSIKLIAFLYNAELQSRE